MKKQIVESPEFKSLEELVTSFRGSDFIHPKLSKLSLLISEFFEDEENVKNSSKVLIFTENRSSAADIASELNKIAAVKANVFMGQSGGSRRQRMSDSVSSNSTGRWDQRKQLETLAKFKRNEYNTLVSTCVGEEGLDIGEVDLVVCFDSGFSPIRIVQRMGRTGRKREGKVYVMLMEGREFFVFRAMLKNSKLLRDNLKMQSVNGASNQSTLEFVSKKKLPNYNFYKYGTRMLPDALHPTLKYLQVPKEEESKDSMDDEDNYYKTLEGTEELADQNKFDDILQQLDESTNSSSMIIEAPETTFTKHFGTKRKRADTTLIVSNPVLPLKKKKETQSLLVRYL